jgi:hypothetical protein
MRTGRFCAFIIHYRKKREDARGRPPSHSYFSIIISSAPASALSASLSLLEHHFVGYEGEIIIFPILDWKTKDGLLAKDFSSANRASLK